jgi:hypothetical protein
VEAGEITWPSSMIGSLACGRSVKSTRVEFPSFSLIFHSLAQVMILSRADCSREVAIQHSLCVTKMAVSSANMTTVVRLDVGISAVQSE